MNRIKTDIIVSHHHNESRVAILENNRLVEFHIEREDLKSNVGKIFKGRVENIVKGLRGAFVDIGFRKNGFLPLAEIPEEIFGKDLEVDTHERRTKSELPIEEGDEIYCQVVKEPMGDKGARLTSFIHLPGKYLVYFPTISRIGLSHRITNRKERTRLKEIAKKLKKPDMGLIVRTAAENINEEALIRDYRILENQFQEIERKFARYSAPHLLYEEPELVIKIVRDLFTYETNSIVVDSKMLYQKIVNYIKNNTPELFDQSKIILYEGGEPLFKKTSVEEQLKNGLERKIWLKSGGFITIEQTEALVTIDVNTGRFAQEENPETLILQTNLEAAAEIARQIRLRDLSGLIIIDFIDMKIPKNTERVFQELKLCLSNDRAKSDFGKVSRFGLLEMTREKIRPGIFYTLCEECPVCQGQGRIFSKYETALKIETQLSAKKEKLVGKRLKLSVSPWLYEYLSKNWQERLEKLIKNLNIYLEIKPDSKLSPDEYKIFEEI